MRRFYGAKTKGSISDVIRVIRNVQKLSIEQRDVKMSQQVQKALRLIIDGRKAF